jgi:hypothetical protein
MRNVFFNILLLMSLNVFSQNYKADKILIYMIPPMSDFYNFEGDYKYPFDFYNNSFGTKVILNDSVLIDSIQNLEMGS